MKDQFIMGPSGQTAIAVPLFRVQYDNKLDSIDGYSIFLTKDEPVAYAIEFQDGEVQLINAELIEEQCFFVGDI